MTSSVCSKGHLYRLPPFTIHTLLRADELAQAIDWSLADYKIPDQWKLELRPGHSRGRARHGHRRDPPRSRSSFG